MKLPNVICLTPVKNEAWILELFLRCASLWADYIIIADQDSDDGSQEIAKKYGKVIVVENPGSNYNEVDRQRILIEAARRIPGPRLLIALDADEFLTPNFATSSEWQSVLNAPKGTVIKTPTAQIKPGMKHYWGTPEGAFGYIDDGYKHSGNVIHSPRVPLPANSSELNLKEIFVMHYQFVDWERMKSKHRWYQCWERIHNPNRSAIDIFRQYYHMFGVKDRELERIPDWWFDGYEVFGIDIRNIRKEKLYRWDREILQVMESHGAKLFKKEAIWDVQWEDIAREYGYKNAEKFKDPRSLLEKAVHSWLFKTQPYAHTAAIKLVSKILKNFLGW